MVGMVLVVLYLRSMKFIKLEENFYKFSSMEHNEVQIFVDYEYSFGLP